MNPRKTLRVFESLLAIAILMAAVSLACSLPNVGRATPVPTAFSATPAPTATLVPAPTVPPPTPTQAAQEVAIQTGTVTLTVGSQKKEIRFEAPDDGDISGLSGSVYSLSWASLLIVTDSAGRYLSEYRFVAEADPARVSIVLKPVKDAPYSQYNVKAGDLGELLTTKKGEAPLGSLASGLAAMKVSDDIGLIVVQPEAVSEAQAMSIYATPLSKVLVVLPAEMAKPAAEQSAVVLSVRELSSLPPMRETLQAQTQKISIADLTGLSLKDLADLQIREPSKLAKPGEDVGYFGNTKYEVKYNQKQIKEFTYYVKNVVVIDKPCASADMQDRIFAMEPPAGSEVVPRDARITLYRCETVSEAPMTVVSVPFAPPASACALKPVDEVMEVALVIDVSSSMAGTKLASVKGAAIDFLKQLDPATTRVALAVFNTESRVLSQPTADFESLRQLISRLGASGDTALDVGLLAGESMVGASRQPEVAKMVLLLAGGKSAPCLARTAADKIEARGANILTVALGYASQNTLSGLASSPNLFMYSPMSADLKEALNTQALRLRSGGQTVARNAVVRLKVNTDKFALPENLLDHGGRAVSYDTVEWVIPEVFPGQAINLPAALRPLDASGASSGEPIGTVEVTYDQCTDGPSTALPPQTLTQVSAPGATTRQVIEYEQAQTGTLEEYQSVTYLLDPNTPGVFSVVIEGAGSQLTPEIYARNGKERLSPLYTVWKKAENKRISTFYLEEPRLYWLTLQSSSLDDTGDYSISVQRGEVADLPALEGGAAAKTQASLAPNDTRVYDLRGVKDGDFVTVVSTNLYPALVGMDGRYNMRLFWLSQGTTVTSGFWVRGKGPFRLIAPNASSQKSVSYSLSTTVADLASQAMGRVTPGSQAQGQLSTQGTQAWTFEGKKGQGLDLQVAIKEPPPNSYLYYGVYSPDGAELSWGPVDPTRRLGWSQLEEEGPYLLVVMRSYAGGEPVDYTVDLVERPLPEATVVEVKSGDTVRAEVVNWRTNEFAVKIEPGQVLSASISLTPTTAFGWLYLMDPQGQASLTTQTWAGLVTLGPIDIRYAGEYTLRLEAFAGEDAKYELAVELK